MSKKNNILQIFNLNSLLISLLLISYLTQFSFCQECLKDTPLSDKKCFNDILIFNGKKYRAGHFVTFKNKDMIVEFSDDGGTNDGFSRIFYGLKANGRYYFPNESPTWEIENIGIIDSARGRYESLNLIVVTEDDLTRENEFIFSTSSYDSLTELHDIKDKNYIQYVTLSYPGPKFFRLRFF